MAHFADERLRIELEAQRMRALDVFEAAAMLKQQADAARICTII